ncbi:tryptophan-rich sensory protein [Candidatus Bathyarchaeota archaeon]|jgi:hypothetical protein|nr:tryptophan-rich sensory protein [Candidatus Bathyarchaeota archaeon]
MSNSKLVFLQIANVAAFVVTVLVNSLANALALNGRSTGEISDLYPTLVTPAGYVFAIWGLIYVLLLIFAVFQALPKRKEELFLRKIGFLFVLSCVFNILWLFAWHYGQITLSALPMFSLLATLVGIYLRLDVGRSEVSLKEKACVRWPFSVYLGWITIASIANVAAALVSTGWDGWGISALSWVALVIIAVLVINLVVIVTRKDIPYSLVIIWALVGIVVKQSGNQTIFTIGVVGIAIIAIALILVNIVAKLQVHNSQHVSTERQES